MISIGGDLTKYSHPVIIIRGGGREASVSGCPITFPPHTKEVRQVIIVRIAKMTKKGRQVVVVPSRRSKRPLMMFAERTKKDLRDHVQLLMDELAGDPQ